MSKRVRQLVFTISLIIFLILLFLILIYPQQLTAGDAVIRRLVNQYRSPVANAFWRQYTSLFNAQASFFWACGVSLAALLSRNWRFFLRISAGIFGGILLNHVIKIMVCRPRPFVNVLMHYSGFSFPSGHSSTVVLIFGSLIIMANRFVRSPKWRWTIDTVLVLLIILIGFSRIYVGAHYPSDVLAGLSLGTAVISGLDLLANRLNQHSTGKNKW